VIIRQSPDIPSYGEYASKHDGSPRINGQTITLQGEDADFRSDAAIIPTIDRTSASTQPSHHSKIRLNTIGGTNWAGNGQWIEWEIEVPESGMYKIGIKYRQNFLSGMTANRKPLIDGQMPFAEADKITFPYSRKWQSKIIGSGDVEYLIFFEAGKKHRIRLENSFGGSAYLLETAQEIVADLNEAYRQLVMFTGSDPDVNRDYKIDEALPDVIIRFERNLIRLRHLSDSLTEFSGQRGDANVVIDNIDDMLARMLKDTRDIPKLMHAFRDNIGGLATWVYTQSRQSLELDYISVLGCDMKMDRPDDPFITSMIFKVRSFIGSFFNDYSLLNSDSGDRVIDVWLTTGRDQAQIISNMISNYFTPDRNIGVNLKLMNNSGQLLMATVAGEGPDAALMNTSTDLINYALRNAVEALNDHPGYDEHIRQFKDSALLPLSTGGKTYGLPETQTFPMLFYRKDVIDELNISIPDTWEDLYQVIGILQRNNLQFGFPLGMLGYGSILYQNGEGFYLDNGRRTGLSTNGAIEAFKQWTRLYNNYGLPVEYDPANRFRSGEMPMLIADYTLYNTLAVFAPEISGLWDFTQVPGTVRSGSSDINRSVASIVTGALMIRQSLNKDDAWEFMKWWTGEETQYLYGRNLESVIGTAARYATANTIAASRIPWKSTEYDSLLKQWEHAAGIPEVAGGYFTSRHIENAFRRVINYYEDEREVIINYSKMIDEEIAHKRMELGMD
jgi:ABC-type glycerol-3-phosphate transport system substrate-binding protein